MNFGRPVSGRPVVRWTDEIKQLFGGLPGCRDGSPEPRDRPWGPRDRSWEPRKYSLDFRMQSRGPGTGPGPPRDWPRGPPNRPWDPGTGPKKLFNFVR